MKKLYTTLGIFFTASAVVVGSFAFNDDVEKYQTQYDKIVQDLQPLYSELSLIQNKISEIEFRKDHIQCLLAQAKKSKGLEVSESSGYCFTKLR